MIVSALLLAATPRKHRFDILGLFWRSVVLSLWSSHFRNMVLSSALLALALRRRLPKSRSSVPFAIAVLYFLYYHFGVKEYAKVRCQATYWNTMIVQKAHLARRPFCPVFWGINRHAQTVTCLALSMMEWLWCKSVKYVREEVQGWDGNDQHLDWVDEVPDDGEEVGGDSPGYLGAGRPICVLIHGLGDDRYHPAILRMARLCKNQGFRVVVFSYWRFDFSESRDLETVLSHISRRLPRAPMLAIGWSAGGHLLINYLGSVGNATPLVSAVGISPATDFHQHGQFLQEEENAFYFRFLGLQAQKCLRRHVTYDSRIGDRQEFLKDFSRFEFNAINVYGNFLKSCPSDASVSSMDVGDWSEVGGSASFSARRKQCLKKATGNEAQDRAAARGDQVLEHYAKAVEVLANISIPFLLVSAQDDPITSLDLASRSECERNRHIILLETMRGGHVGFYDGFLPFGTTWDARSAADYMCAVLEALSQTNYTLSILKEAVRQGLLEEEDTPHTEGATAALSVPIRAQTHASQPSFSTRPWGWRSASNPDTATPAATASPKPGNATSRSFKKLPSFGPVAMRRICSDTDVAGGLPRNSHV